MKRIIAAILTLLLVAGLFSGCGNNSAEFVDEPITRPEFKNKKSYGDIQNEEFVLVAERNDLKLLVQPSTTQFKVENSADGSVWFSNPQNVAEDEYASQLTRMQMQSTLAIEYTNIENKKVTSINIYTAAVRSKKYTVDLVDDGVVFEYEVKEVGKKFFFAVRLGEGYLYTDVWYEDLEEKKEGLLINAIQITPYFVSGRLGDDGYLFIPDGSGALVDFDTKNAVANSYSRPIYGEEPTSITRDWYLQASKQSVKLPVFGVARNGSALFAIAETASEIGVMNANACGQKTSYANAYISYNTLASVEYDLGKYTTMLYDTSVREIETITTRYYFLSGENANYSGMARKYRDYLSDKYNLGENKVHDTFYADVYGGVLKKVSTLGVPHDKLVSLTTAEQLAEMCDEIKQGGANDITVRYRNWNSDELKGKRVDSANAASALSFEKLNDFAGVNIYPSVISLQSYSSGGFFDSLANATYSITGLPFSMNGYLVSNLQANDKRRFWVATSKLKANAEGYINGLSRKGFKNIALSDITIDLYADYRDDIYLRDDSKKVMEDILGIANDKFDSVMADAANEYAIAYSNVIYNTPISHSMQDILSKSVPFYSIAIGGLVDCVAPSFNGESANDKLMLTAAASGTYLCYSFISEESSILLSTELKSLTNMNFGSTIDDAMMAYNEMKKIADAAEGSRIYSHRYITDTLTVTEYENGACVYVNFSDTDIVADSVNIAADSFVVIGGNT